jgi:carbon-monoxide dehydrogenase large subunit
VRVVHSDTDAVPEGQGTYGSRSLQLGGSSIFVASENVLTMAKERAATLLEANPDDVVLFEDGRFGVAGTPARSVGWDRLAGGDDGPLRSEAKHPQSAQTYPFGAHVAVVEVDTETGKVTVKRVVTVDDAGVLLNPMIVEGQRHGGIAQGVGQALCEEMVYDPDGNPVTSNFADYTFISAAELPSFELVPMETPTNANPLGAKGIGESGTIGATPAVQSAVVDALSHLGIRHIDMPATPQRVWSAIQEAR